MTACAACLRSVLRFNEYDITSVHLAFLLQKRQKRSPSGITDRLRKAVIFQQIAHLKIFRRNQIVAFDQLLGNIVKVVSSLPGNFSLKARKLLTLLLVVATVTKFTIVLLCLWNRGFSNDPPSESLIRSVRFRSMPICDPVFGSALTKGSSDAICSDTQYSPTASFEMVTVPMRV